MPKSSESRSGASKVVATVKFSEEQRRALESSSGLSGLTGLNLVELGAEERARIMPGLAKAIVTVLCW